MTISFSGPSSGIDTNAWVEALVKMKQASVTNLEQKKETLVYTTSVLDNVKSFFASFKSVLTNVTQSNLGIASFDLFLQNLVETSNADVVTASVTTEAQEANYEVYVDQVATETEAKSAFLTNIISTTQDIATHNSLLSSIGIGTGKVGFLIGKDDNGNDIERIITLQSNDTIGTFLDKLNKIGIDASYDPTMGLFSINVDTDHINDIDNTGIIDALCLQNVNSGYSSDFLELTDINSFVVNATETAKMSLFGITDGTYTITDADGNNPQIFEADTEGTFLDFFNAISRFGLTASFDEEGIITINTDGRYLISGALAEQLGIVTDDQSYDTDTKAASTVSAFSTEVVNAEYNSTLGEIGAIVNDSDTLKILDVHRNLVAEITSLTKSSTIDDLFEALAQYSIAGSLNNNVISFDSALGYIIEGKIAENLGVQTYQTSTTTIKTGNSTTSTGLVSYLASATDWVSDCLWDVWDSYSAQDKVITVTHRDRVRDGDDNLNIQTYTYTVTAKNSIGSDGKVQKGTQFQDIIDWYKSIDPTSTFVFNDQGQIQIDSNDTFYLEGKIAEYLGIGGYSRTYTWTEGITTTTSSETISYRVRKTDYISDVLWDNGWLTYSDTQKVISAYSITVDHTTGNNSVNNPVYEKPDSVSATVEDEYTTDGLHAEGNYIENSSTYQHTVKTLIGTFTIKQGQTTFEDLSYWFTHVIDQTAAFEITNEGKIVINSDNNMHLEGKAITDLGLGISTYAQSWTTGTAATQSTGSVTYQVKMTDYISDTFTATQWSKVNKMITVYSNDVDHSDGDDGNQVYQKTVQVALTTITIDTSTTFNSLKAALAEYHIDLSIVDGVVTLDSRRSNYLVEEEFMKHKTENGVDVMTVNTNYNGGKTSILDHFGIKYDTVAQTWTTGTASTESTGIVNYVIKMTDYMSDTFTATEWNNLYKSVKSDGTTVNTRYTDSSGVSHGGREIAVMHSYIDHTNQKTIIACTTVITITTSTTFNDLQYTLKHLSDDDRYNIDLSISDGILKFDSNCCWVEGLIPDHYGVKIDTYNANWTTGTASTQSTGIVQHLVKYTDYISDTFTKSDWDSLASYTDSAGGTHGGKTLAIMHSYVDHTNQKTIIECKTVITLTTETTFQGLKNILATMDSTDDRNNITLGITEDGVLTLDSNACWIEGSIANHYGVKVDTYNANWTTGTASTESTGVVQHLIKYTDYISDTFTKTAWDSLASYTDSAGGTHGGKTLAIMHSYIDHANQKTIIECKTVITLTTETTFQGLKNILATMDSTDDRNNITLGITEGGVLTLDSNACWIEGSIADHYGVKVDTYNANWTTGTASTESTAVVQHLIKYTDYISDTFTKTAWDSLASYTDSAGGTHGGKTLAIMHSYVDHTNQKTIIECKTVITLTTETTFQGLKNILATMDSTDARNNITLGITDGGVLTLDSNCCWVEGSIANHYGIKTDSYTASWTTGTATTQSTGIVTYKVTLTDYVSDTFKQSEWNSLASYKITTGAGSTLATTTVSGTKIAVMHCEIDHTTQKTVLSCATTITVSTSTTFNDLKNALSPYGITLSINGDGVISFDSSCVADKDNSLFYIVGSIPDHWGTYVGTIQQNWTTGTASTQSTADVKFGVQMWDYISDGYKPSKWDSLTTTKYTTTSGETITDGRTIAVMHAYLDHSTHKTVIEKTTLITIDSETTYTSLANKLGSYGISLTISNGVIKLDSDESSSNSNGTFYIEGNICKDWGSKYDTKSMTWTLGTASTSSTSNVSFKAKMTDYISDAMTETTWNSKNKVVSVYHNYLDHSDHTVKTTTALITLTSAMTFTDLNNSITAASSGSCSIGMSSGVMSVTGDCWWIGGEVVEYFGAKVSSTTQTWTYGGTTTSGSSITYNAVGTDLVMNLFKSGEWTDNAKKLVVHRMTYDRDNHKTVDNTDATITVTDTMTIDNLFKKMKDDYGITGTISDGTITLDSSNGKYVTGDIATRMGLTYNTSTQTYTYGVKTTSTAVASATINTGDTIYEYLVNNGTNWDTLNKTIVVSQSTVSYSDLTISNTAKKTFEIDTTTTFGDLSSLLGTNSSSNLSLTLTNGVITMNNANNYYATGDVMTTLGITTTTSTQAVAYQSSTSSSSALTYSGNFNTADKISDLVGWGDYTDKNVYVYYQYYDYASRSRQYYYVTGFGTTDTTISSLSNSLSTYGITLGVDGNKVTLSNSNASNQNGYYISGDMVTFLGLDTSTETKTVTAGKSYTGSKVTAYAKSDSKMTDFGVSSSANVKIRYKNALTGETTYTATITVGSRTFAQFCSAIHSADSNVSVTFSGSSMSFSCSNGRDLSFDGISLSGASVNTATETITQNATGYSGALTYDVTVITTTTVGSTSTVISYKTATLMEGITNLRKLSCVSWTTTENPEGDHESFDSMSTFCIQRDGLKIWAEETGLKTVTYTVQASSSGTTMQLCPQEGLNVGDTWTEEVITYALYASIYTNGTLCDTIVLGSTDPNPGSGHVNSVMPMTRPGGTIEHKLYDITIEDTTSVSIETTTETHTIDENNWNSVAMSKLGISNGTIKLLKYKDNGKGGISGETATINVDNTKTLYQLSQTLSAYGITLDLATNYFSGRAAVNYYGRMRISSTGGDQSNWQLWNISVGGLFNNDSIDWSDTKECSELTGFSTSTGAYTKNMDGTTRMTEIGYDGAAGAVTSAFGVTNSRTGHVGRDGYIWKNTTVNQIIDCLNAYTLGASVTDGKLTISASGETYLSACNSTDIFSALGLSTTMSDYSESKTWSKTKNNTSGSAKSQYITDNNKSRATLGAMGYSADQVFTVYKHDDTDTPNHYSSTNYTWSTDTSLSDFVSTLNGSGLTATFSSSTHKVTVERGNDYYYYLGGVGSDNPLKLTASNTTSSNVTFTVASSGNTTRSIKAHGTSDLGDYGISSNQTISFVYHTNGTYAQDTTTTNGHSITNTNATVTVTWTTGQTLSTFISNINGKTTNTGITATLGDNGKVTFSASNKGYISSISSDLNKILKIGTTTTTDTYTLNCEAESNKTGLQCYINNGTTLGKLGLTEDQTIEIVKHTNNTYAPTRTTVTVTWTTTDTFSDVVTKLSSYGITASVVTSSRKAKLVGSENYYIDSISDGLKTALDISTINRQTYNYTLKYKASSDTTAEYTYLNTRNTYLANMGITANQTMEIVVHKNRTFAQDQTDGGLSNITGVTKTVTVTWTTTQALGTFINNVNTAIAAENNISAAAADYKLNFSVDKDTGKLTFTGSEWVYVQNISKDLKNKLNISTINTNNYKYSINYRANADNSTDYTYLNERNSKLANLGITTEQKMVVGLHKDSTFVADNTKTTGNFEFVTFTWSTTQTLGEFESAVKTALNAITGKDGVAHYDMTFSVDPNTGKWKFTGNEYTYVHSITSLLETKTNVVGAKQTNGTYGKSYASTINYRAAADGNGDYTYVNERNTKLGNLIRKESSGTISVPHAQTMEIVLHTNMTYAVQNTDSSSVSSETRTITKTVTVTWTTDQTLAQFEAAVNNFLHTQTDEDGRTKDAKGNYLYNMTFSVDKNSGKWSITGNEYCYIRGFGDVTDTNYNSATGAAKVDVTTYTSELETFMKLSSKENNTYGQSYSYTLKYRADSDTTRDYTYNNERNTKLSNLRRMSGSNTVSISGAQTMEIVLHTNMTYAVANTDSGKSKISNVTKTVTVTWTMDQTLAQFEAAVNNVLHAQTDEDGRTKDANGNYLYNISFSVDKNTGKWKFTGNEYTYVNGFGNASSTADVRTYTSDLETYFNLSNKGSTYNNTYGKYYNYTLNYRADSDTTRDYTYNNERNTKLSNLRRMEGNKTVSVSGDQTMEIVLHTNMTYAVQNTDSNSVSSETRTITKTVTVTWTMDQTLAQFEAAVNNVLHAQTDEDGRTKDANGNYLYNITFSVDKENGKWKFTGNEYTYINGFGNASSTADVRTYTSDLETYFKLNNKGNTYNNTYGQYYNYTLNYRADADTTRDYTYLNERNTKLSNMRRYEGNKTVSVSGDQTMEIVLHTNMTYAVQNTDPGNSAHNSKSAETREITRTITVTWTMDQTLAQFEAAVNNVLHAQKDEDGRTKDANGNYLYNMTFSVDPNTGKWKFTGNEYTYVNGFGNASSTADVRTYTSDLETYLKLSNKGSTYNNTYGRYYNYTLNYRADADKNKDYTYVNERNTKLHNMGITSNQSMTFVVHTNNTFAQDQTDGGNYHTAVTRTITVTWETGKTLEEYENKVNQTLRDYWNRDGYGKTMNVSDTTNTALTDLINKIGNKIYYHDQNSLRRELLEFDSIKNNDSLTALVNQISNSASNTTLNNVKTSLLAAVTSHTAVNDGRYYIKFEVDPETGKWKFTGDEHVYVQSISSQLENFMKLKDVRRTVGGSTSYGQSYDYTMIYRADADKLGDPGDPRDYTYLNERNTTLDNLSYVDSNGNTIRTNQSQTIDIVIHINNTYAQDTTKSTIQQKATSGTLTIFTTSTVGMTQQSSSAINYNITVTADSTNTFSQLGFGAEASQVTSVYSRNGEKLGEFTLSATSTLADFCTAVNNLNSFANARVSGGKVYIDNGYASGALATKLGLVINNYGVVTYTQNETSASAITYYRNETITTATTLRTLGFTTNDSVEVFGSDTMKLGEFTLGTEATVGDFINAINSKNSGAAKLSNGVISISKGYITGTLAEMFGLNTQAGTYTTTTAVTATGDSAVIYTVINNATSSTKLSEVGVDLTQQVSIYDRNGNEVRNVWFNENSDISEFLSVISNTKDANGNDAGVRATYNGSKISITNGYVKGQCTTALGITVSSVSTTTTSAMTLTSSAPISYVSQQNAVNTTTMEELGIDTTQKIKLYDKNGVLIKELTLGSNSSVDELVSKINNATYSDGTAGGAEASFNNSKLEIVNGSITWQKISGTNNISSVSTTATTAATVTGAGEVVYTVINAATGSTLLRDLGISTSDTFKIHDMYGTEVTLNLSMAEDATLNSLVSLINNTYVNGQKAEVAVTLDGNKLKFSKGYISGDLADKLGVSVSGKPKTVTTAAPLTSATPVFAGKNPSNVTFHDLGMNTNADFSLNVYENGRVYSESYDKDTTVKRFLTNTCGLGFSVDDNGYVTITGDSSHYITEDLSGGLASFLQISQIGEGYSYNVSSQTIYSATTGSLGEREIYTIETSTTLAQLGLQSNADFTIKIYENGKVYSESVDKSTSILQFLNNKGLTVSVNSTDGKVTISGDKNHYICEDTNNVLRDYLKIESVGDGSTYEVGTKTTYTLKANRTNTISFGTTLAELGLQSNADYTIKICQNGRVYNESVSKTTNILQFLADRGLTVSVNSTDGKVTISGDNNHYIYEDTNNILKNYLKISEVGSGHSYSTNTVMTYRASSAVVGQRDVYTISNTTTLAELGLQSNADYTIKICQNGRVYSESVDKSTRILEFLTDKGLTVSINPNDGKVTISGDDNHYIYEDTNNILGTYLHITNVGENYTWTKVNHDRVSSTNSRQFMQSVAKTFTADTTFADLGISLSSAKFVRSNNVVSNGTVTRHDTTFAAESTSLKVVDFLKSAGFDVTVNNGQITVKEKNNNGYYINTMNSALADALNLSVGEGHTYYVSSADSFGCSPNKQLKAVLGRSITEETTLSNLLINTPVTVTTNKGSVTINADDKVMAKIRSLGLDVSAVNGTLSISGTDSTYITGMSDNLRSALKFNVGENKTWEKKVSSRIEVGPISNVTRTVTVAWTYSALGTQDTDAKPETLKQFLEDINKTLAAETTKYKELFNLSEDFNISAYVDGDGKFHFVGDEYTYVSRVDDFLARALKIKSQTKEGSTYGKSYQYQVQYANNSNNQTQYTYTNYDNMRLQNFDVYENQYITIVTHNNTTYAASATDDRIVKNGTVLFDNTTTTYVITWTVGSTGHTLNNNGSFNNNDNALRDGETFEELKYQLEHFGSLNNLATEASAVLGNDIYKINVTINPDNTISLVGNEYTYILGISDALKTKFKIQGREGLGYYYSKYDYKIKFNNDGYTDTHNTTMLNYDTRLDNLSIMADMTMTIETPDGGKSIVFDHDTTIEEMKERLFSDYGIDVTIQEHTGRITFTPTRIDEGYYILGMDTELKNALKIITGENGVYTLESEQIISKGGGKYGTTVKHNVTSTLGTYGTSTINNYDNTATQNLRYEDDHNIIKNDTRISRINGYNNGNGNITVHYADGYEQNISIRESMSLGQLCDIFKDYGVTTEILAGGRVTFKSNDGTYLKSAAGGSNLLDVLNVSDVSVKTEGTTIITSKSLSRNEEEEYRYFATEDTLLSTYSNGLLQSNGVITFALNDSYKSVTITSDDTFGTLIQKFKDKGLNAKMEAGKFSISSGYDTFSIIQDATTTSSLAAILNFNEKTDLGGYAMTDRSKTIISTTTLMETKSLSISNYADDSTQFGTFNVIGGSLSIFIDGKKAGIQVSAADTVRTLQSKFRNALGQNVNGPDGENLTVKFEDGCLKIYQDGANVIVGSNEDSSNFSAITGAFSNNGAVESTRSFYKANENTLVTAAGIFRNGTVTAGDFVVGDATISIDNTTTIGQLVSMINTNSDSNVTAYWDGVNGELRMKSNNTGDFYINFEGGSSNFTDVMGYTRSSYDAVANKTVSSINTDNQKNGKNARVTINGASYTSTSNTMGSDVTGLKGLTLNLKGMSNGEATILSVKKDVKSLALAISDVVDAYNALIDNINTALNSKSELRNDSELKRLRNHIKSIMTGTNKNSSIYKSIMAIGIVTDAADPTSLTVGSGIFKLTLDYDKFAKAFEADSASVRTLLLGKLDEDGNLIEEGILTRLEALIDESIDSAGGYFERTEESFDRQITRLDNKIVKGNEAIERYRERLEKKYMSMNILNSNVQTQYQVYFN